MGDAVTSTRYTPQERTRYREKLRENLETFDSYLERAEFDAQGTIGLELEINLVDGVGDPALRNGEVLTVLDDADFQSEIGAYNVELNMPVMEVAGTGLRDLRDGIAERLESLRATTAGLGLTPVSIGTLPTVTPELLSDPSWMTDENRYRALSNAILDARGEFVRIDVARDERCAETFSDIAPESTCTSVQLHLQVAPNRFADAWNASQAIAGVQAALAANAPLLMGRRTWHESRIPVFAQAIDTRTPELVAQGVRPRVWFGERWITSVFDLFEENVRYFPPLLPESREAAGDPLLTESGVPRLHELNLHNGTVWRWNRPIYDTGADVAHIRIENRLLPAGPTPADMVADAAFYYGLLASLMRDNRPIWSRMSFATAEANFFAGARDGLGAVLDWPKHGRVTAADLIAGELADRARAGLAALDVDDEVIEETIGIAVARAESGQTGAQWQLDALRSLGAGTAPGSPERQEALRALVLAYAENQATGAPVHTWEIPTR